MKNYYYILGVKETATFEEIKKSYKKLCHKFHPDKNNGDASFTEKFREIKEAYEILIDSVKRKNYDTIWKYNPTKNQRQQNQNKNYPKSSSANTKSTENKYSTSFWVNVFVFGFFILMKLLR